MRFFIKKIVTIACSFLICCALNSQDKTSSFVRNAHSMIYNSNDSKVYLFGGADEKEVKSDLYFLEEAKWHKIEVAKTPRARTFACMVYDEDKDRIILFGGNKVLFGEETKYTNLLNDTWEFRNNEWIELKTENSPSPRAEASMVYDPIKHSIILFGGYTILDDEYVKLGDTWEFFDNKWTQVSNSGPTPRSGASMIFDENLGCAILFGGSAYDRQYGSSKGETWVWKSNKWTKLDNKQPRGIYNSAMAFSPLKNITMRFGGWDGETRERTDNTWFFDNNQWHKKEYKISPSPRNHSAMVYDKKNHQFLLFGGHDGEFIFGDIWVFIQGKWSKLNQGEKLKRIANSH